MSWVQEMGDKWRVGGWLSSLATALRKAKREETRRAGNCRAGKVVGAQITKTKDQGQSIGWSFPDQWVQARSCAPSGGFKGHGAGEKSKITSIFLSSVELLLHNRIRHSDHKRIQRRNMGGVTYATVPQTLTEVNGLVVRQKTQKGEAVAQMIGIPFEATNKYKVHLLPPDKVVKSQPEDPDGWEPTAEELEQLDTFLFAQETSGCFSRLCLTFLGCGSLRPLQMHFSVNGSTGDVYVIQRPFQLGGCCCCPLEMNLDAVADGQQRRIGRVREDFSPYFGKCLSACCLATTYTDIERAMPDGSYEKKYSLRTNVSCCGRVNNCCGATCCKNDAVYDILDAKGEIVAHLQMTYAKGKSCLGACCRMGFSFNNYILEFPSESTAEDRMLLLTAVFQVEYQLFERKGDE